MRPQNYPKDPHHLWEHFYAISQIPRPSGQESAVRQYVIEQAEAAGHGWQADDEGNLVVRVAATAGLQNRDAVVIQNHLDMVTVKSAGTEHNFDRDPISLQVDQGWLSAQGTTLGADNGVGCAAALALMTSPGLAHPPLELLFTVDEETGLNGALKLDASLLTGSRMLNLDTEDWQQLFVGCAGGAGWQFERRFVTQAVEPGWASWTLHVGGLSGGHSGIQIHEQLGNAIKLGFEVLMELPDVRLIAADLGVAHNVIPREGWIAFAVGPDTDPHAVTQRVRSRALSYLPPVDASLALTLTSAQPAGALAAADTRQVADLVAAFPHGALAYNAQSPADLVDLSSNLAVLRVTAGDLFVESSYRFFNAAQSVPLTHSVDALARAYALHATPIDGYPGWKPDFDSLLLAQAKSLHQSMFGVAPAVKAIHAGLECGIVKSKKPELDILSFGPTIRGAHSPTERLEIATVKPFWQFLTTLLSQL